MVNKTTPCEISASQFVAESLELEADKLPPGEPATILRNAAIIYRTIPTTQVVRVIDKREDFNQAAARIVKEATERD
jgi:hypothetical protein